MNIAKRRIEKGMTQGEVAEKIGVDRSTVAKWETGKAMPRMKTMVLLAVVLRCTLNDLIAEEVEA